jgi:hypothetical protein
VKILVLAVAPDVVVHARMVVKDVVVVVGVLTHARLDALRVMHVADAVDVRALAPTSVQVVQDVLAEV